MNNSGRFRFFAVVATTLFAISLSAQRYQGRDHHVFHRPPATHVKHQPALPSANVTRTGTATATTHTASAAHSQDLNLGASPANTAPHPPKPATTDSDRVH